MTKETDGPRTARPFTAAALAFAVAFCATLPQEGAAQGIEFGGGLNFADLSGIDIESTARNIGMNLGLDVILPAGPIGLGLGLDWAQKGLDASEALSDPILVDLSYLELPLTVRLPVVGTGPVRLNLVLGPRIGINTGCTISVDQSPSEECETFVDGFEPSDLDWSGTAGLGISFRLGNIAYAGTDLTYVHGFSDVSKAAILDPRNRTFTLQAHFGFDAFGQSESGGTQR